MENFEQIHLPWKDWKIVKRLGGGAYGEVYEIERNISGVQEKAAVKIVSRPKDDIEIETYYDEGYDKASIAASYEKEIQNYVQEYTLMKKLQGQTNIVSCDDFTVVPHDNGIGGDVFIRMELLTSLQQKLKQKKLTISQIVKLGKDISNALILCERKNIIHRDIKPANIMVSEFGDYKLGDFGVSKIMDHTTYATAMGTPEYQAPEIVHMEKYGQAADIYSLGIMLYWLLNNRKMPFIDVDEQLTPELKIKAMERRYRGEALPVPKHGSAKLKKIVLKACEYQPEDRYASAQELYDALDSLENGKTTKNNTVQKKSRTKTEKKEVWSDDGRTAVNSWSDGGETIGTPSGLKESKKPSGGNQEEPKTIGPWSKETKESKQPKQSKKGTDEKVVVAEEKRKPQSGLAEYGYDSREQLTGFGFVWYVLTATGYLYLIYVIKMSKLEGIGAIVGEIVLLLLAICSFITMARNNLGEKYANFTGIIWIIKMIGDYCSILVGLFIVEITMLENHPTIQGLAVFGSIYLSIVLLAKIYSWSWKIK
ncbi:MAG: serine/threonine protein kinase [Dorea formicigenerans]|nr:serine/threonine protein kinase [Dorea formicigenerans]